MQLDLDVHGRKVVVFGSFAAARRVVKRYQVAGARVIAVVDGPMPPAEDRLPGVRYAVQPEVEHLSDWINLLGPAWLAVLVGLDPATTDQVRRLCGHLRIVVTAEPAAAGHGVVTLVGGGPGTTELLTVQACDALREADVVFYDRLAPTEDLERLAPAAELVDVGKRPHHHPVTQGEIQAQMIDRARRGASVVRLKGGDPFVFGRGGEEVLACVQAGVAVHVVPGVSSSLSVPAAVGIPLTHRGVSHAFTVISGHDPLTADELTALAQLHGTLVILMGVNNLPQISAGLVRAGLHGSTPAAVIERGYSATQRTTVATVDALAGEVRRLDVQAPAVIVIGEVVRLIGLGGDRSAWLESLELLAVAGRHRSAP
jgi:uroporphyrin-III C-methyltransferase